MLTPVVLARQATSVAASCATAGAGAETETYLGLVTVVVHSYREARSHQQLLARCPALSFREVTNDPAYAAMQAADSLPPGFEERVYEFLVSNRERGVVDGVIFESCGLEE